MTCACCGDDESRVDGYCSCECQALHAVELERDELRTRVAALESCQRARRAAEARVEELEAARAPLLEWAQHGADDSRWRPGRTIEQSAVDRIAELEAELARAVAAEREACAVLADTAAERAVAHVVALPIEAEYVRAWRAGSAAASSDLARDIRART